MTGTLLIVAAPSGAGKTSLVRDLIAADPQIKLSVSYTTRAPRPGELHGVHYHFVDVATFQTLIAEDAFLEWAEVHGNFYGTARARVLEELTHDFDVLLEIDWQGARQVRARFPQARSIFILPPSKETLLERLRSRGQDSESVIAERIANARAEMLHCDEFDFLLVNEDFERALTDLRTVVAAARLATSVQCLRHRVLLSKLLDGQ